MSRTVRKHESAGRSAKRGPDRKVKIQRQSDLKTNKQRRVNARQELRREYR